MKLQEIKNLDVVAIINQVCHQTRCHMWTTLISHMGKQVSQQTTLSTVDFWLTNNNLSFDPADEAMNLIYAQTLKQTIKDLIHVRTN